MKKGICFLLFAATLTWMSCTSSRNKKIEEYLESLGEKEALVSFNIGDKEFYRDKEIFLAEAYISKGIFNLTLSSKSGDKTIISFGGEKWYERSPIHSKIQNDDPSAANIKIGKLIDAEKMIGEGYMMTEGEVTAIEFSPTQMVFEISGLAGKYSDFQQPDKHLKVKGLIVCKQPQITMAGIDEKQVFASQQE